ncbi:AbrB/MazE/SpoVT family DNA-binding domain-containing protein [Flavobacteriaceae bacterium]|nr:AbrB/MazE/SpoVT family DNA-binding domain-containing protein [Flavobacteriaceae bacterium]
MGNSKGLRLSKTILKQYGIVDEVELIFEKEQIVLKPISAPKTNWETAFEQMRQNNDDTALIPDVFEEENTEEWT